MTSSNKLIVNYKDFLFQIDIKQENTVMDLKYLIYTVVGLKPSRQSFPALDLQGNLENNNCKLRLLNLHSDGILKVIDKFGEVYSVLSWKLKVEWRNIFFKVFMDEIDTILDLKCLISKVTGLKVSLQSFDNLSLCDLNENDYAVQHLTLDTQFILKVKELPSQDEVISLKKLKIQWGNMYFKIDIASEDTILGVKSRIYTATDLKPTSQVFLNLSLPDYVKEENCLLEDLNLESRFLLKICGKSHEQFPVLASSSPISWQQIRSECSSIINLIGEHQEPCPHNIKAPVNVEEENDNENYAENECKKLSAPRPGKKLVVLDIDHTIIDYHASRPRWIARPYLQMFLEGIYEEFEIGVWSATEMKTALLKLCMLGMLTSPKYKILFCMNTDAMTRVTVNRKRCRVKPLSNVWRRYPQFSPQNTVICDDRKSNFLLNKKNGIQVRSYYGKNHAFDNELLLLLRYLKHIAQLEDLRMLNHEQWRNYGIKDSASCSSENENGDISCSGEESDCETN